MHQVQTERNLAAPTASGRASTRCNAGNSATPAKTRTSPSRACGFNGCATGTRRHPRPQERARPVHAADGRLDLPGRAAAHLRMVGILAPILLVDPAADPGLRGRRRDLRRQRDDHRALAVRPARLLRQLHPAGRAGRSDPRRRDLPAAVRDHVRRKPSRPGAGGSRSCSARSSCSPATSSGATSTRPRRSRRRPSTARCRRRRSSMAVKENGADMLRVVLHGADERDPDRGDRRSVRRSPPTPATASA